jgi:hypothetical protein
MPGQVSSEGSCRGALLGYAMMLGSAIQGTDERGGGCEVRAVLVYIADIESQWK